MERANNLPIAGAPTSETEDSSTSDANEVPDIPEADTTEAMDDAPFANLEEPAVDATVATQRFNELLAQHDDLLRAVIYRRIPPNLIPMGLAESVIGDVYAALYDKLLVAPMHENPAGWLTMVAKRKVTDELRRHIRRTKREVLDHSNDEERESLLEQRLGRAAVAEHTASNNKEELRDLAAKLLAAITEEQRDLLIKRHIHEKDMPEIAAWLTEKDQRPITQANARVRLTRARQAASKAYYDLLAEQGLPQQTPFKRFFATAEDTRERS
jgi:RNA polymerase sigma factor (sigma-70 family)